VTINILSKPVADIRQTFPLNILWILQRTNKLFIAVPESNPCKHGVSENITLFLSMYYEFLSVRASVLYPEDF
jgi:hypothetical protein